MGAGKGDFLFSKCAAFLARCCSELWAAKRRQVTTTAQPDSGELAAASGTSPLLELKALKQSQALRN